MRVYAIWQMNKRILCFLGFIAFVNTVHNSLKYEVVLILSYRPQSLASSIPQPRMEFRLQLVHHSQLNLWPDSYNDPLGTAPQLFGDGCYLGDIVKLFWVPHFILLINESSMSHSFLQKLSGTKFISLYSSLAMLTLTLAKAYLITQKESGQILSRGYRMVTYDGIAYFILFACASKCHSWYW